MYRRDFAVLILSACALYFSIRQQSSFHFKKAWYAMQGGGSDLASWFWNGKPAFLVCKTTSFTICHRYHPYEDAQDYFAGGVLNRVRPIAVRA